MTEKTDKKRMLVVEDESVIAQDIKNSLLNMGYEVMNVVASGEEAVGQAEQKKPDLVLMDIVLQGKMDGIEAAGRIRSSVNIPVIYLTAYADENILEGAKLTEPFGYMIKPFEEKELYFTIEMALYKHAMQERLLEQGRFVRDILDSLTHPFYVIDANDYTIKVANTAANLGNLSGNPTCYALTHREAGPCHSLEHPCPLKMVKETGRAVTVEHVHYDKDGRARDVEVHCYPIFEGEGKVARVIEYSLDITERKRLEKQFLESQKMESVGRLASGVAHDFSNIMSAVLGYSEMAMMELPEDHPAHEKLKIIRDAGEKAAVLTRQLLAFSSKQVLSMKPLNLNAVVEDMAKMLIRLIGEDIRLRLETKGRMENVMADQGQISQILLNLAVNARDAMPKGGDLVIETSEVELDAEFAKRYADVEPGPYVMLAVTDTGEGIEKKFMDNIFEPFFTTKQKGKGTGLGLATVYGIVKQHKGHISVYSEEGMGTSFHIYLPAVQEKEEERTEEKPTPLPRGTETVLVVDDEPSIRHLIGDALRPLGYRVLEASNGEEAIKVSDEADEDLHLLITDVVMPGVNGRELSDALSAKRAGMKTIFMSGYTDNVVLEQEIINAGAAFLQKPLRPSILAGKLREVLNENG
jgi:signal transduction histidine kinase/response regulator RpfG family c-di-GMP phosphodiesterase